MKKKYNILVLALSFTFTLFSQSTTNSKSNFWDNVQFGGGLVFNSSNIVTNIGVSPSAIYNFNDSFSAGVSVSYLYSKQRNISKPLNAYGTSVIALFNPINELQVSSEYEMNFLRQGDLSQTVPALYFGVGYRTGRNIAAGVRYDVLYDENKSLYASAITPFVRVFF